MINNLYENNQFGGIPSLVFNQPKTNKEFLFCCHTEMAYSKKENGTQEKDEKSKNLIIDDIQIGTFSKNINTPFTVSFYQRILYGVHEVLKEIEIYTEDREAIESNTLFMGYGLKNEDCCEDTVLISQYLNRDYQRYLEYQKKESNKGEILKEHDSDQKRTCYNLIEFYNEQNVMSRQKRKHFLREITKYQTYIEENKKEIEDKSEEISRLNEEINELKTSIKESLEDIEYYNKQLEDLKSFSLFGKKDEGNINDKKVSIDSFLKECIDSRNSHKNTPVKEESSIPEVIQRKASFFIENGLIKEKDEHYILLQNLSGSEFAHINKYKKDKLGGEYFTLKEMSSFIWKNNNTQYTVDPTTHYASTFKKPTLSNKIDYNKLNNDYY